MMVALVIPFIVWEQSFGLERLQGIFGKLEITPDSPLLSGVQWTAIGLVLAFTILWWIKLYQNKPNPLAYIQREIFILFWAIGGCMWYLVY
ncbi:MAG: hypothetical protein R2822_06580 [Spirosomataceae bacterium]